MPVDVESPEATALKQKIDDQGLQVRSLKSAGGDKAATDEAVKLLLKLKSDYKELTGVDLSGGGSSKKNKKESAQKEKPQPKQRQPPKKPKSVEIKENKPEAKATATKVQSGSSSQERDMSMAAVLTRLAQRSTQADQIVAHLRTQLASVRQSSELSACKTAEERLRSENETLKRQVEALKLRLTQAEIRNGVTQVAIPSRSSAPPVVTPQSAATAETKAELQQAQTTDAEPKKKKEKKENKPKAPQGGGENASVDISRIDMRVGQIVGVKYHPDADSLYVEEVNLGEGKNRTILSGLVKHIPIEQMQDRLAIFMANLKPAKMRGIFSEGMIMCGSTPEKVEIIELPAGAKIGDKVYVEGYEGVPDQQLNPKRKIFEQVQPDLGIDKDGAATYKGVPWKVKGLDGLCTVPTMRGTPIK